MGLLDKLRGELVDIVEWLDIERNTLVWRFPRYHNQIKNGAQLIVRPGQLAVFIHQGKLADVFEPGTYSLDSRNLPILSTLEGWKHGFESPFKAEVYFVTTRQLTDLKWGTPNPVIVRDPGFGPIRVRAFGSYTLKAKEPMALLTELVGTDPRFEIDEIGMHIRSIINEAFADVVASAKISVPDLASNYADLADKVRRATVDRVDDEFGLDIPQLTIVNISLPAEVERALDARSSMNVIDDLARYQHYQIGHAMPVAAANPAGGLAGAGVGLGMGVAVAGQMLPAAAFRASGAESRTDRWYIAESGQRFGPFTTGELAQAVAAGRVGGATLVWTDGMADWLPAAQVPQLGSVLRSVPPVPPPPPPPARP